MIACHVVQQALDVIYQDCTCQILHIFPLHGFSLIGGFDPSCQGKPNKHAICQRVCVALTFDSCTIYFFSMYTLVLLYNMLICAASNNKRPEKEQPAGNTKSNMMRLWPANNSTCHVSSLYSDQKLVATHVKINKTNRDVLKTKNVLPKNSMKLFITIGIMIPQHGWDVSPGWDPYPPCKACHCCSHTYQKQCNECLAITSVMSSASFKDAVQGLISGKVAYGSLISQNLTYSNQGETCS